MAKRFQIMPSRNDEIKETPCVVLHIDDIPEAKEWKIGEEYEVTLTVEMKSLTDRFAEFEITEVEVKEEE